MLSNVGVYPAVAMRIQRTSFKGTDDSAKEVASITHVALFNAIGIGKLIEKSYPSELYKIPEQEKSARAMVKELADRLSAPEYANVTVGELAQALLSPHIR